MTEVAIMVDLKEQAAGRMVATGRLGWAVEE